MNKEEELMNLRGTGRDKGGAAEGGVQMMHSQMNSLKN